MEEGEETVSDMPKDGIFHGSFFLPFFDTTPEGKQNENCECYAESDIELKFSKIKTNEGDGKGRTFQVAGKGFSGLGKFRLHGTAFPAPPLPDGDERYTFVVRKQYEPPEPSKVPVAAAAAAATAGVAMLPQSLPPSLPPSLPTEQNYSQFGSAKKRKFREF